MLSSPQYFEKYCLIFREVHVGLLLLDVENRKFLVKMGQQFQTECSGLGGVVVIDAAIGAHGRGSRPVHYLTVAATLDKSLTSHCL